MKKLLPVCSVFFASFLAASGADVVIVGDGSVSSSLENCAPGDTVTLSATAAEGKCFFRWAGNIGNADPVEPLLTYTVPADGTMPTAYFGNRIVVDISGGGDYTSVDAAVAAAQDYDTVFVKDGTYVRDNAAYLEITKPVSLVSENGADKTFIRGSVAFTGDTSKTLTRGLHINHPLAVVKGFNVNTFGNDGGQASQKGMAIRLYDGLVEYCTASNCRPNRGGMSIQQTGGELRHSLMIRNRNGQSSTDINWGGGGLLLTGGVATNCVIRDCTSPNGAPGAGVTVNGDNAKLLGSFIFSCSTSGNGAVALARGLVDNCIITNNSGNSAGVYQTGGTLSNSLIAYNRSSYLQKYGGLYSIGGTIENCRIFSNTAYYPEGRQLCKTAGEIRGTTVAESEFSIPSSDVVAVSPGVTVENSALQVTGVAGATVLNASDYFSNGAAYIRASSVVGTAPMTVDFAVVRDGVAGETWQRTYTNCGVYTEEAEGMSRTIRVLPTTSYVSNEGSDTFPYDTPEKATPDFTKAIEAVYTDDSVSGEISVAAGTYTYTGANVASTITPWLFVNRKVTVSGATSNPEDTKFDASSKTVCMLLTHPEAVLRSITISNGRLNNNSLCGGSLYMTGGLITNCIIEKGYANFAGNAVASAGKITGTIFRKGSLSQSGEDRPGGGLQIRGPVLVENCLFEGNTGGYGGGFSSHNSGAVVSNCVVRGNGGGLCCGGGIGLAAGLVTHCVITNNASSNGAGGVRVSGGTLRNCLVANNTARGTVAPKIGYGGAGGGGISINSGKIENCTVYGNKSASSTRCDELFMTGGTVRNSAFVGTDPTPPNDVYKTGGTLEYSFARVSVAGNGNISGDAKLSAPVDGDFSLAYGSPCIDAGTELADIKTDITGKERPVDGNGDGTAETDIGCYEFEIDLNAINAAFDADVTSGGGSLTATFTAEVSGGTAPYRYLWTFGVDSEPVETTVPTIIHTFNMGTHTVTLTVIDSAGNSSAPVERKDLVSVKAPEVYMSTTGSATWPYATWETATPELSDAVDAVYATDAAPGKIFVADGTYTTSDNNIFSADLSIPVELVGTNAEIGAVFVGKKANSIVHKAAKVANPKSKVANLRFTSYRGDAEANCSVIWLYSGTVSNCVFDSCNSSGAGMIYQEGGLLTDSVLEGCDAGYHSGGDRWGALYMAGGTAQRLVISGGLGGNSSAAKIISPNAVLRDSVIRNNNSDAGGPIYITAGLVENCVITNNTSYGNKSAGNALPGVTGAGIVASSAKAVVRNCLIAGNRLTRNSPATGGALFVANSSTAYNNTCWANTLADGSTNDVYSLSATVKNTVAGVLGSEGGTVESNYAGSDPGFRNAESGDFRLGYNSPCKDAGDLSVWGGKSAARAEVDLEGNRRCFGDTVDLGCYEIVFAPFMLIFR